MANVFDQFDSKAQGGNVFDQFDEAPKEVTAGQAGKRGLAQGWGAVNQWAGNIAMLPVIGAEIIANQFRDKPDFGMSEWGMGKFVQPFEAMQQENAIKQGEELSPLGVAANVAGNLVGQAPALAMPMAPANQAVRMAPQALPVAEQVMRIIGREFGQAQPLAQSAMVQRSNQLQAEGVPTDVANNAALAGYGVDAIGYAVPISATGNVLKRVATGAPANVAASLPAVARENYTLEASGYGDHATDPFSVENLTTEGVTGAVLAALLGQRAPRYQTAEMVQQGRAMDAANDQAILDSSIVPDSGLSIADLIQQMTGAPAVRPDAQATKQDMQARRKDAAQAFGNAPEDQVIYSRDSLDPLTGEMSPSTEAGTGTIATDPNRLVGQQQNRTDSNQVDPDTAANYGEQGIDPNSIANAFARARLGEKIDLPGEQRSLKAELGPDEVGLIEQYTGMTPEDIANLGPNAQRRVLARAMQAQEADAGRGTMVTSYGEEPLSSPASKPDVPGDRMAMPGELDESGRRITGDAREAGVGADVDPAVAKQAAAKKAKMVEKLDAMRKQQDAMDESPVWRDLKRKQEMGLGMTDKERKAYAAMRDQREKLGRSIFDLEGKIYDIEARSEQGSRTSTGTSDRPFRMDQPDDGSFEQAARPEAEARARAKAADEERAAIDRMEAEWRERQRMRRQEEAQQQAGQRKQESDAEQRAQQKYAGKKGSTTEAPMEGGKFKADENGFVMSDTGSPLQFGHQRDAGWWILKRGNKGNTGQVFEIANHPSGNGYTVRVTMDNGGSDGGGRAGDGGSTVGRDMGGGDLVPRSGGDRGTGGKRGAPKNNAGTGGRTLAAGPVADAGQQDAALGARATDVDQDIVAEVQRMAENTGLAQQGGRVIRDPVTGEVTSRTTHVPNESWWLERPHTDRVGKKGKVTRRFKHDERETKEALQAWVDGKPLTRKQQEIVDFMVGVAENARREDREAMERMRDVEGEAEAASERDAIKAEDGIVADEAVDDFAFGRQVSVDDFEAWLGGNDGQGRSQGDAGQADAGEAQGNRGPDRAETERQERPGGEAQEPVLEPYGQDDIRARDEQRAAAERDERPQQPVEEPDDFVLTGSNRPADQAEARGQTSIFGMDEPKQAAEAPKPEDKQVAMRTELDSLVEKMANQKRVNTQDLDRAYFLARELRIIDHWFDQTYRGAYSTNASAFDALKSKVSGTEKRGGGTLYSNPFADPQLWAQMARDAGFALKKVAQALRDAYGWTERETGWFGRTLKELRTDFVDKTRVNRGSASFGGTITRLYRAVLESAGTDMMAIARSSGSKTMQDLVRKFVHVAGDMSGQAETMSQRVEFEWNRHMSPVARALDKVEQLARKAGRDEAEVMRQVANLVRSPNGIRPGNPIHDAAKTVRKALDDALAYMREAGVEMGEVKDGYYPREFDTDTVIRQGMEFLSAAAQAYREAGLSQADAAKAADELMVSLTFGPESIFRADTGKPQADFMKGRVFGKQVDDPKHPLHKFLIHDPRMSISSYLNRAVKRAELARIIGETPEQWAQMRADMINEGASPDAINDLADFIQTTSGMRGDKGVGRAVSLATSWMRTMGTLMFLEKATLTSIPEMIMPAIRAGNVLEAHRSVATTFKALFMKNRPDMKALTELADDIGILSAHMSDTVMMNRWHGGDYATALQTKIMDRHFKMTGLTQYTEATRLGALAVGQTFVRRLAKGVDGKLNRDYLGEVGIPADKADAFAKWLMSANDGMPSAADLRAASPEMRKLYMTAMRKFEADSIMRPNMTTRPAWMNKPVLGLLGQLQSYNYAFYNHVLKRVVKNAWKGLTDNDYTALERMQLAKPLLMLPMLAAMQGAVGEIRDALLGDPDRELETWQKITRAFSRGIPVAPVDPIVNVVTGAKYQRSSTETIAGPTAGTVGRFADAYIDYYFKNSEGTNTQERAVAKSFFDVVMEPTAAVMLSYAWGNSPWQVKAGLAAARQAAGSGQVRDEFIEGVAGPKRARSGDVEGIGF